MFSSKLKSFRDETSAWYNYLALLWAIGLGVTPFAEKYIFGGERAYFFAFCGFMVVVSLLFAGWTSFKLRAVVDRDRLYYGFRRLEKTIIYEADQRGSKYTLQYIDKVKAIVDQRMLYPVRYKWSGDGTEGVPRLKDKSQQLVAIVGKSGKPQPYITSKQHSPGNEWHYYFVALSPLPAKPTTVSIYFFKPFSHKAEGMQDGTNLLDPANDHVIRWTVTHPKNGYRYQIEWTI